MFETRGEFLRETVQVNSDYVGEGYGLPTAGTLETLRLLARLEGILLDPVYSGKGMAGLIDLIRKGHYCADHNIVFIHTGGSVGLFGYRQLLEQTGACLHRSAPRAGRCFVSSFIPKP
jgi:L-cysteate sulfo-lyase